jgi:uncharacterized protein YdeI (YjbR/CyaY-like superfamily)
MNTLYVTDREDFRSWLEKNHESASEIWLIFYKKQTGRPNIPLADAVEEGICFGWIDSLIKKLDENRYARKFTPRKHGSIWTGLNLARAQKMISIGRMTEAGLAKLKSGKKLTPVPWKGATKVPELPADLNTALSADKRAQQHFARLTARYVTMCLSWIEAAKRPETRERRIREFVALTARNERIGMK